tara:strand:+ start:155 stop:322 length:168 start_codon:yes stop_codon:yes gene_type:complete
MVELLISVVGRPDTPVTKAHPGSMRAVLAFMIAEVQKPDDDRPNEHMARSGGREA